MAAGTPDSVAWCLDTSPAGTPQIRLINTTPTPTLVSVDPAGFGQVTTRLGRIVGSPSSDAGAGSSQPTPTGRATPLGSLEEMVLDLPSDLDNGMTIRASTEGTERLVVLEQVLDTWLFLTTGVDAAPPPDSLAARSIRLISESDCVGQEVGQEAAGLAGIAECLRPAIERSTPTSEPFVDSFDIAVGAVAKFAAETSPRRLEPNPWELTITRSGVPIYIADSAGLTRRVAEAVSPLVPAPGPVGRIDTSWDGTGVAWTGPRTSGGELKVVSSSTAGQIHVLPVGSEGAATGPSGFLTQAGNAESAAEVDSDGNQRRRATGLVGAEANLVGLNPGGDLVLIAPSGVVGRETVWISRDERPRNIGEVLAEGARFLSSQVGPDEPIWVAATSNPDSCTASSEIWRIDPSPGAVTRVSNAPLERSAPGTRFLLNDLRGLSNGRLIATWIERSSVCGSDPTAMWTIVYEGDSARVLATDLMQADVLDDGSLIGIVGRVTGVDGREAQAPGALVIRRPDGTEETVSTDATSFAIAPGRPIDHPLPDPGDVAPDTAREATPEESLVDLGRQLFDPRSHTGECRVNLPSPDTWCHGETDRTENEVRWLMRPSDVPDALPARARRNADGSWLSRVEQAIEVPPEVPSEPPPTTTAEPTAPRSLQLNPADRALVGVPFGSDAGTAILEMSRVIGPPDMDTGWRSCVANAAVDDTRTLTWGALAAEFERNPEDARFARWVLAVGTGSAGPDVASIELAGPANSITGSEPIASIAEGLGLELTDSGGLTWVRASDFTLSAPEPASRIDTIGAPDLSAC